MTRLVDVDPVIDVLRRAGATGRGTTLFASLGLHFNVETPALDAQTITAVLKASRCSSPGCGAMREEHPRMAHPLWRVLSG